MKLLFAKNEEETSTELKEALGFIDADFPLVKIKPDLRTATSEFIEVVGQDVYDDLYAIYNESENQPEEENESDNDELLTLAQYAIATAAYRLFAPANDLNHGVNGRKMLTSEDSKTPFEHMLVASNEELERRSFRAMDDFLRFLDDHSETWKASENYKASHRLFVRTTKEFDFFFVIKSRYLLLKLQPALAKAEKSLIIPRIGKAVYTDLKEKRNGTSEEELTDQEEKLLPLIQEATVYAALSWGVLRLQGTLFPEGYLQNIKSDRNTISAKMPFEGNQVDQVSQLFKSDSESALREIEDLLTPDPEPKEIDDDDSVNDLTELNCDDNFVST